MKGKNILIQYSFDFLSSLLIFALRNKTFCKILVKFAFLISPKIKNSTIRSIHQALGEEYSFSEIEKLAILSQTKVIYNLARIGKPLKSHYFIDSFINDKKRENGIIITSHTGCWENLESVFKKETFFIYRKIDNPFLEKKIKKLREGRKHTSIDKRDKKLFQKTKEALKKGKDVLILCDQQTKQGINVLLFNKPTCMSHLPFLLALKTKKPIYPLQITPRKIQFLNPIKQIPKTANEQSILLGKLMTKIMDENKEGNLWLHQFWKTSKCHLKFQSRKKNFFSKEEIAKFKPHRVLITIDKNLFSQDLLKILRIAQEKRPDIKWYFWSQEHLPIDNWQIPIKQIPSYHQKPKAKKILGYQKTLKSPFDLWINLNPKTNSFFSKISEKNCIIYTNWENEETIEDYFLFLLGEKKK